MSRTASEVLAEMLSLTPSGGALPRDPASNWGIFLAPLASAVAAAEAYAEGMLPQIDPRLAEEFLGDFARVLGPDPYGRDAASNNLSATAEAALLWSRWTSVAGCSIADFTALAAGMGSQITIEQFTPTDCGAMVAGDSCTCAEIGLYWLVTLPVADVTFAECGDFVAGELLGSYQPNPAGTMLQDLAPAHTKLVLNYVANYTPLDLVPNWETFQPTTGPDWSVAPTTDIAPLLSGVPVWKSTQTGPMGDSNAGAFPFAGAAGAQYAMSLWVYLPPGFSATQFGFRSDYFLGLRQTNVVDPTLTGVWQYVGATGNATVPDATVVLGVDAEIGAFFYLTCPNAQTGAVPTNFADLLN